MHCLKERFLCAKRADSPHLKRIWFNKTPKSYTDNLYLKKRVWLSKKMRYVFFRLNIRRTFSLQKRYAIFNFRWFCPNNPMETTVCPLQCKGRYQLKVFSNYKFCQILMVVEYTLYTSSLKGQIQ